MKEVLPPPLLFWLMSKVEALQGLRTWERIERCHWPIRKECLEGTTPYKEEAQGLKFCRLALGQVSTFISEF